MSGSGLNLPVRITVEGGAQAEAAFNRVAATGERAMQTVTNSTTQAASSGNNLRYVVGQAGYQVQDFAVQVQGGTSALTALSQQGSQLLGVFGPAGAIAGAVLTVGILAAQFLGLSEKATTLDDVMKDVDGTYKRVNDAAKARILGVIEEAEALNRLAIGYTVMSAASQRAEAIVLDRQRNALAQQAAEIRSTSINGLRGLTNPTAPDYDPQGNALGTRSATGTPNDAGLTVLRQALDAYDQQTRLTVAGQRELATTLDGVARTAGDNAVAMWRQRDAILDSLPAVARLEEAQKQTAIQTVALMQAQGASREEIVRYTSAFGGLANEIVRTATSMQTLARINSDNPFGSIEESVARTEAQLVALRRGGLDALETERQRQAVSAAGAAANQTTFDAEFQNLRQLGLAHEEAERRAAEAAQAAQMRAEQGVRASQRLSAEERIAEEARRASARGGGGRAARPERDIQAILAADRRESTEAFDEFNRALNLNEAGLSAAQGALSRYERDMQMLDTALTRRAITEEQFAVAVEASTLALGRQIEEVQRRGTNTDALGRELGMTFSSAFEDAIVKGKSFSDVLKGIEQDIARIIIRQAVTAPLSSAISGAVKNIDFGAIATSLFPGRADGGFVSMGATYLVGERGPELFTPGASGNITPNHAMGGENSVTFSPTYNIDARNADASILPRVRAIAEMVSARSLAQFADSIQRGGSAARLVGRR